VALDIPPADDILTHLAALPAAEAAAKHAWLLEHERELALGSVAATGAVELVRDLAARGCRLGILTRNAQELAHITLKAIGLADCFAVEDVLGRDDAPPKPDPGGLLKLAQAWDVAPAEMVMVGDYRFDLGLRPGGGDADGAGQPARKPMAGTGRLACARLRSTAPDDLAQAPRITGRSWLGFSLGD
jgi:FMN phosphatase YigB (HAD superfamily)